MRKPRQGSVLRQRGAALVGVLALLAVSLLIGVSAMQTALIDERMAGNYRQATQLGMKAEWAAAEAVSAEALAAASFVEAPVEHLGDTSWQHLRADNSVAGHCPGDYHCRYGYWLDDGAPYIVAMAWVERESAMTLASLPVIVALESATPGAEEAESVYQLVGWH